MPKDPLSQMGLVRRPVFEIFQPARGAARDPAFSQGFRQALVEDQGVQRKQRIVDLQDQEIVQQQEAQDAVDRYSRQAPNARQQFLENNPAIALAPQFGNVARYESMNAERAANAARTLAPSMARKLPPMAARRFYESIDMGMGANEAFEDARDYNEQEGLREKLYATGADDEEIKKAFPGGRLTAPEIARFETQRKIRLGTDPEAEALQKYSTLLNRQIKTQFDTTGKIDTEAEAEMMRVNTLLGNKLKAKAIPATVAPKTDAPVVTEEVVAPAAQVTVPTAKPTNVTNYMEMLEQAKKEAAQKPEKDAVAQAWTQAKADLQKKLDDAVPDRVLPGTDVNQREAFARAVLNGEEVIRMDGTPDDLGNLPREPLADQVLQQIGLSPAAVAFEEPGNRRTGTQGVKNYELMKAWAEDFLNSRGKLLPTKESATGAELTPDQQAAFDRLSKIIRGEK